MPPYLRLPDVERMALDEYMSDFIKVARVAFTDDPQRLERLGLVTP